MKRKPAKSKFWNGQVVLLLPDWHYVRIVQLYFGRTNPNGSLQEMAVLQWPFGKTTARPTKDISQLKASEVKRP